MFSTDFRRVLPRPVKGTVVSVDLRRRACKVITDEGGLLRSVTWASAYSYDSREGDAYTPLPRDRVVVEANAGEVFISKGIGRLAYDVPYVNKITDRNETTSPLSTVKRLNLTSMKNDAYNGAVISEDSLPGDRVLTTRGGAMMALMHGGGAVIKGGPQSELYLSGMDGLARISSRFLSVFSDARKEVDAVVEGSTYSYREYYKSLGESEAETKIYSESFGAAEAGDAMNDRYPSFTGSIPISNIVRLRQVPGKYRDELTSEGTEKRSLTSSTASLVRNLKPNEWDLTVTDSSGTVVYSGKTSEAVVSVVSSGNESSVKFQNDGKVNLTATTEVIVNSPISTFQGEIRAVGDVTAGFGGASVTLLGHSHIGNLGSPTTSPIAGT